MDISGLHQNEAREIQMRYNNTVDNINKLEKKSLQTQDEWFEKRANMYSVREINRKNFFRQLNRDRHALDYVLRKEKAEAGLAAPEKNPFERRACRPVAAWDTKLTATPEEQEAQAAADAAAAVAQQEAERTAAAAAPAESI